MQELQQEFEPVRLKICRLMADGGYLARVKQEGPALARWHRYLQMISQPGCFSGDDPLAQPTIFPMMDGLASMPWRDAAAIPATKILESSLPTIRRELAQFDASQFMRYPAVIIANGQWTVLP